MYSIRFKGKTFRWQYTNFARDEAEYVALALSEQVRCPVCGVWYEEPEVAGPFMARNYGGEDEEVSYKAYLCDPCYYTLEMPHNDWRSFPVKIVK